MHWAFPMDMHLQTHGEMQINTQINTCTETVMCTWTHTDIQTCTHPPPTEKCMYKHTWRHVNADMQMHRGTPMDTQMCRDTQTRR